MNDNDITVGTWEVVFILGDVENATISLEVLISFSKAINGLGLKATYISEVTGTMFIKLQSALELDGQVISSAECPGSVVPIVVCSTSISSCTSLAHHLLRLNANSSIKRMQLQSIIVVDQEDAVSLQNKLLFALYKQVDCYSLVSTNQKRELAAKTMRLIAEADSIKSTQLSSVEMTHEVLLIGSGGREHAIAHKLSQSNLVSKIYVAPGNGGTVGRKVENIFLGLSNEDIVKFALSKKISLVVVGPEQPLVDGLCDTLRENKIACFGPSALAARLESSKAWSKDFMCRNNIRTASYKNFTNFDLAKAYIESLPYRVVIKASGLAAGKGVVLPINATEAVQAAKEILLDNLFGDAGHEIVIEEFIEGEEVSVLAFCDGISAAIMPAAQDHKRIFDYDQGPNTGGMGAYAPAPILTPELKRICCAIIQKTIDCMTMEGCSYEGILYAGFMITKDGPVVLEYNCRFGDPETQVLLPLLDSDFYEVLTACVEHRLYPDDVRWKKSTVACTVVCASQGYPGTYRKGDFIQLPPCPDTVTIYHAGTSLLDGKLATSGGRVLAVTALGPTIKAARQAAYKVVSAVKFDGRQNRNDIANRALGAPLRIGVLGSTRGSALQPVIDAIESGALNAKLVICISNKADALILERASRHKIPTLVVSPNKNKAIFDSQVTKVFETHAVDLVMMVGYMRIVSSEFTSRWKDRCLNVHPSLLPDFAGGMDLAVHQAVIDAHKSISGCTVHFVTDIVDGGPIAVQSQCQVLAGETAESLKAKVQSLEGPAFVKAIEMFMQDKIGPGASLSDVITYSSAGVDIDAGEALVEAIKPMCKRTRRPGCDADLGGFGGLFDLASAGYASSDTILVSGTDGVGTKLKIAQAVGKHDTIGIDLVAMSVNDILVCGAEPLFFLDYYATGALNVTEAAQVVKGIAEGCFQSGCGLIGGETAEMAGMYAPGEYDLAGFAVGAVKKSQILPQNIKAGDVLIGIPSSGVHSNGYSLVRKCVDKSGLQWTDPSPFAEGLSLSDSLLTPTKIYIKALMPLIKANKLKGMAHITGGGLLDNVPRVLPDNVIAEVNIATSGWTLPPVFKWLQKISNLPQNELLRTFNCGIGMVLVVEKGADVDFVLESLRSGTECPNPLVLGNLVERVSVQEPQVRVIGDIQ